MLGLNGAEVMAFSSMYSMNKFAIMGERGVPKNGIAVHVQKSQHTIDWGAARVQATAIGYWNRRTMEAIQIRRRKQSMNLDCGLHLSPVWNPLVDPT